MKTRKKKLKNKKKDKNTKEKIPNSTQYKPMIKDKEKKINDTKELKPIAETNKEAKKPYSYSHKSYYNRQIGRKTPGYTILDEKGKENEKKQNKEKEQNKEQNKEKEKEKEIKSKEIKSPPKAYKKEYNTNVGNLENYAFKVQQEKLGENILEITKKNHNIISFIDIDLFLQRIANEKKIYDDTNDNDTLLNGFCIQHPNFINTSTLITKISDCFNYYYKEYLNEVNDKNKSGQKYITSSKRRTEYRPRYKHVENKVIVNNISKKIPFCLIDLMILFVDLHEKYSKETLTKEVIDKIAKFYKNLLDINEVKNKYKEDIEYSNNILNAISKTAMYHRTKTNKKILFGSIFEEKSLLENKIRDPDSPLSFFSIFDYNSSDIAKELTRISYNILSEIKPKEFFKGVFTKKNKNITSPNITEITNRFNQLSFWLIEEILSYDYPNDRAKVIEKFIDIGKELINLNNFNDAMSIVSGLGQMIVNNLNQSWKYVSKQSNAVFEKLKNILNFQDNYKNIRDKIDECLQNNIPYIPFLGPYNKRICFLEEYGPYVKNDSLINVDKIVLVQQILDQFFKFRTKQYSMLNSNNKEFIILQCLDPLQEEELDQLSSFLEPNFTMKNGKSREKRVTNTEKKFKQNYENKQNLI